MNAVLLAHAGHWLTTIGFALAPLTVIAGIVLIAIAERRRGDRSQPRWTARRITRP